MYDGTLGIGSYTLTDTHTRAHTSIVRYMEHALITRVISLVQRFAAPGRSLVGKGTLNDRT